MAADVAVRRIDAAEFTRAAAEAMILSSVPVVVSGATRDWPAAARWASPEYLLDKVGANTLLPVRRNTAEYSEWLGEEARMPFGEFLEQWRAEQTQVRDENAAPRYYLASLPIKTHFPLLVEDVLPPPHAAEQEKMGNLWIGSAGQVTPVHFDYSRGEPGMDGFHYLLSGRKVFTLFDPAENAHCFARRNGWWKFHHALVDIEHPDLSVYPEFAAARPIRIELGPGDMLFIPKMWWHHVHTTEPSIAVNFWFEHLGSEKLKLTTHWPAVEAILDAASKMQLEPSKMRNLMGSFGCKDLSEENVAKFTTAPIHFMALPVFVECFGNGARSPFLRSDHEAEPTALAIIAKVRASIERRLAATTTGSPP